MAAEGRFDGTLGYVRDRWPGFVFGFGGGALLMIAILWLSVDGGYPGLVVLAAIGLGVLASLSAGTLWSAHHLYDNNNLRDSLVQLSELEPTVTFAHLSLGRRQMAVHLSRRLTTGRLIVVDVYNPQLTPSRTLARSRGRARQPQPDPRLTWRDGHIDLLPLPDRSVPLVTMDETIGEFYQYGDRLCLLKEIYRILEPRGRLVLAERLRTKTNLLVLGPAGLNLKPAGYWRDLMAAAGLQPKREVDLRGLICCIRAEKPLVDQEKQLLFDF